jgi:hypothetical protein
MTELAGAESQESSSFWEITGIPEVAEKKTPWLMGLKGVGLL